MLKKIVKNMKNDVDKANGNGYNDRVSWFARRTNLV